jgi:hypothetical protein
LRQLEQKGSEIWSASLDFYRAMRDASTEASFFGVYANMFSALMGDQDKNKAAATQAAVEPRELPYVKEALASISEGGYAEAFARTGALLQRHGEPLPLARLQTRDELSRDYAEYLPADLTHEQFRRIRGEQEIIAHYEPEQAVLSLSTLLADAADRSRLLTLFDKLIADPRVQAIEPSAGQIAMLERIRAVLGVPPAAAGRRIKGVPPRPPTQEGRNGPVSVH